MEQIEAPETASSPQAVDLETLKQTLRAGWWRYLLIGVVTAGSVAGGGMLVPPRYQASCVFQVGAAARALRAVTPVSPGFAVQSPSPDDVRTYAYELEHSQAVWQQAREEARRADQDVGEVAKRPRAIVIERTHLVQLRVEASRREGAAYLANAMVSAYDAMLRERVVSFAAAHRSRMERSLAPDETGGSETAGEAESLLSAQLSELSALEQGTSPAIEVVEAAVPSRVRRVPDLGLVVISAVVAAIMVVTMALLWAAAIHRR